MHSASRKHESGVCGGLMAGPREKCLHLTNIVCNSNELGDALTYWSLLLWPHKLCSVISYIDCMAHQVLLRLNLRVSISMNCWYSRFMKKTHSISICPSIHYIFDDIAFVIVVIAACVRPNTRRCTTAGTIVQPLYRNWPHSISFEPFTRWASSPFSMGWSKLNNRNGSNWLCKRCKHNSEPCEIADESD